MTMISRRAVLAGSATVSAASVGAAAAAEPNGERLACLPTRVFKIPDYGKEGTESWLFNAVVVSGSPAPQKVVSLRIDYFAGERRVRTDSYDPAYLDKVDLTYGARGYDPDRPDQPAHWPVFLRIRGLERRVVGVDRVEVRLDAAVGTGRRSYVLQVPIAVYRSRNTYVFPFKGPGLVKASQAIDGGHRNRSGLFAFDVFGVTPAYAVLNGPALVRNADMVGYGRDIIAPAAGRVVIARNDRPDQPKPGAVDPDFLLPQYRDGGDPGNLVIIDHGGGEFSMIAHLQPGSVTVRPGDAVAQGQVIGRLGASGDTSAPHLHYQLQDGPNWERANGLPVEFSNVDARLYRGELFEAT